MSGNTLSLYRGELTSYLAREYITITKDYPLAAARAFNTLADTFKFVYISGTFLVPILGDISLANWLANR